MTQKPQKEKHPYSFIRVVTGLYYGANRENISAQKDEVSVGGERSPASARGGWKWQRKNLRSFAVNEKAKELDVQKAEHSAMAQ